MTLPNVLILIIIVSLIASVYKWYRWGFSVDLSDNPPTEWKWLKAAEWAGMGAVIIYWTIALSGCTRDVPKDVVVPSGAVTVQVPVPTCGDDLAKSLFVTATIRPSTLPINQLSAADKEDYERVSKAYMDTIEILTKYAVQLERDRSQAQQQCKATRDAVNTLNTKTPVIPAKQ